ncbi:MAG: hypothetical protein KDC44_24335 [Phaeodactylibacter sp.]|nr:hypothetical protein [Phaeodactylibacter sp.]
MKTLKLFVFLAVASMAVLTSCNKDCDEDNPEAVLPGTWDVDEGGTITFNSDGTGTSNGSDFFTLDFFGDPLTDFTWSIVAVDALNDSNLLMEFESEDGTSSGSMEFPVNVKNCDRVLVGVDILIDLQVELTR